MSVAGRNKLTLIASPAIGAFGNWVEQLIAESTGKEGIGIVPVVGEPPGPPEFYGKDRLFVHLRVEGDDSLDGAVQDLESAGHPVVRLRLKDPYDLGGQFFLWEMATAVAGHRIGINPFDQPNVESAKILARRLLDDYRFLQWTADAPRDVPIPEEAGSPASSVTFGVLKTAQALGDRQALLDAGRRVLRVHLGPDALAGLASLMVALP